MRKFILVLALLSICSISWAESVGRRTQNVLSSTKGQTIAVDQTSVVYSLSFPINNVTPDDGIGVMYKCAGTTCDVKLELQQSYDVPATEGSADSAYLITNVITAGATDEGQWRMATIDTVTMTNARIKLTGQGSNSADAVVTIKISK